MSRTAFLLILGVVACSASGQGSMAFADSLRNAHGIPEIGYAVVTADSVLELEVSGIQQAGTERPAGRDDRFRIGSNTKTVTSFIAALMVHKGVLHWNTRFFDLFPELKSGSNKAYLRITLRDLLTFRARLIPYTYTDTLPRIAQFSGDATAQRSSFIQWALQQTPVTGDGPHFSNLSYVLAGAMLERASGKSYAQLVQQLGTPRGIHFGFGAPNRTDSLATWGHRADGTPEAPADDIKLEWLMAAGNLNLSLPDFATFAQLHLQGLAGRSTLLSKEEFQYLHTGAPTWALGWKWTTDPDGGIRSFHVGNPGTFLSEVFIHHASGKAYLLFANRQSPGAQEALDALYAELVRRFEP